MSTTAGWKYVRCERTIDNVEVRLVIEPAPDGRARIVEAHRRRPREERYSRARHLEMTDDPARLGLPADAIEALERLRERRS